MQDGFQFFQGIADGKLAAPQILAGQIGAFIGFGLDDFINARGAFGPLAEGLAGRNQILQRRVFEKPPLIQINADGLAGTNAAFLNDAVFGKFHHAGLRTHNQHAIGSDAIAQRPQAITIQPCHHPAPIGRANRRRAIPGFHHSVAIQEQVTMCCRHGSVIAKALGYQQRLGHGCVSPGAHQQFEHVIECRGIRTTRLHHGLQIIHERIKQRMGKSRFMRLHPIHIAMQRIDFAIMRQRPEGLSEPPGGEGISGIALMINGEAADETFIQQIRIEFCQRFRQEHALIDDGPGGQGTKIKLRNLRRDSLLFDPPADHIHIAFNGGDIALFRVMDQDLFDLGPRRIGLFADAGDIDRHLPPAINGIAGIENFSFHNLPAAFLRAQIGFWQKHLAHGDTPGTQPIATAFHHGSEEILRDFDMNAGPIAGFAIGIHGAAMPNGTQRINAGLHNFPPWLAIKRCHQANTAGIMFCQIKMRFGSEARCGSLISRHKRFVIRHGFDPSA